MKLFSGPQGKNKLSKEALKSAWNSPLLKNNEWKGDTADRLANNQLKEFRYANRS